MKRSFLIAVWMLFTIYLAAVCCLCFLNCPFSQELELPATLWNIPIDKVVHFTMFLPFPILSIPAFNLSLKNTELKIKRSLLTVFSGVIFAAATELIQTYLLVERDGDLMDFTADVIGLAAGLVIFFIFCPPIIKTMREH